MTASSPADPSSAPVPEADAPARSPLDAESEVAAVAALAGLPGTSSEPDGDAPFGFSAELLDKVARLPRRPGVYVLLDVRRRVLYVGKAKSLRDRVRSYFARDSGDGRYHVRFLMGRVRDLEVTLTETEKEALILEDTLIKKHRPRYNIRLRDDKTYTSLRLDLSHPFPKVRVERRPSRAHALVFGPFSSAQAVRATVAELHRTFPLRTCSDGDFANRSRPCLDYQIGKCLGPCVGLVSEAEYGKLVEGAVHFLRGQNRDVVRALRERMAAAASALRYEEAARVRDRIRAIEATIEKQHVVRDSELDQDFVAVAANGLSACAAVLTVRGGVLVGSMSYPLAIALEEDEDPLEAFLARRYGSLEDLPDEVVVPRTVAAAAAFEEWWSERRGRRVRLFVPERGDKRRLAELAEQNAAAALTAATDPAAERRAVLAGLRRKLDLAQEPRRIECTDMSTLGGTGSVGSIVRFEDGVPEKDGYRRYRIRSRTIPDDYGAMHEVLSRRFAAARDRSADPDLLIVDGGKGQLNVAVRVFRELALTGVELASIAKDPDRIFRPGRSNPISLRHDDPGLLLLGRIRDEAHRFAITYQRKVRGRERIRSELDDIPGVGPSRRKALLTRFGSVARIREASIEELAGVAGMNEPVAHAIHAALATPPAPPPAPSNDPPEPS
ncbi:MAG: excinuclease ABC subunit UvrC [bacterium]